MRVAAEIRLTKSQRTTLQQWSRGRKVAVRQAQRAKTKKRRRLARDEAAPRPRTGFAATMSNWPPRGYKAQRRAERNARAWAFNAKRR